MTPENPPDYCMRGHRVPSYNQANITELARRVCKIIKIKKASFKGKNTEKLITHLENYGIHVDVIDDIEWIDATRATVDTQSAMIYIPEKLHSELCRGKAEAIRIFLHELGHIFLCHKPLLHFSSESEEKPKECEDSEWQADYFADAVIRLLDLPKEEAQLEFKF